MRGHGENYMKKTIGFLGVTLWVLFATACGSGSSQTSQPANSTARGTLALNPPFRIASLDAAAFTARLGASSSGVQLLQLTGPPACGVDFYYLKFWTVGAVAEPTLSSGALMVPTGGSGCSGPRPILLYAHGTVTDQAFNIADITNPTNEEGALIAAAFAAQGYIVAAPNYAGYDISNLGYHPFLNASQQSGEMTDMLAAARTALPKTLSVRTTDNGKLFVTGYSEGGYVAMATQRALGSAITASAPLSGPYALEAFGDALLFGSVNLGSTVFGVLAVSSYQHAYGNIYAAPTDLYSATFATGIDTLLPSVAPFDTLVKDKRLPATALFNQNTPMVNIPGDPATSAALTASLAVPSDPANPLTPLFRLGFGDPYLVNNSFRVSYALDALADPDGAVPKASAGVPVAAKPPGQPFRRALYTNDLRNTPWVPSSPTLLCGGSADPTVFFAVNTLTMQAFWSQLPRGLVTVLDVNATPSPGDPFAKIEAGFIASQAASLAFYESPAGGGLSPTAAAQQLVLGYHTAVAPFCTVAARAFFSQF